MINLLPKLDVSYKPRHTIPTYKTLFQFKLYCKAIHCYIHTYVIERTYNTRQYGNYDKILYSLYNDIIVHGI